MAASLTLAALPAAAVAVPTTQADARDAMLVPGDARAAGLPASLVEIFEPELNEKFTEVLQTVEFEQIGTSATKVSSANRAKVNQLAQTLAQRWTVAP
jgi:ubiquinone biosynthesis protein UbiJ